MAYLEMREGILEANEKYRSTLSKDLGAIAGLLFEIGTGRIVIAGNAEKLIDAETTKREKSRMKRHQEVLNDLLEENEHSEMQYHLARLGQSLGYKVWIAQNDHKREKEIKAQLLRPSFRSADSLQISYILFSELRCDCDAMCKFGTNVTVLDKISKVI